jgi:type VI secretion system FHA domain protein
MTTLTLTVLRCPDAMTPEQRQVHGGELILGRGAECGWTLADPARSLSRKHCMLEFFSGQWRVRDLSTNGTFVNFESTPVGRDQVQSLRGGDRLRLGDYEIEVSIGAEAHAPDTADPWGAAAAPIGAPVARMGHVPLPGLDELPSQRSAAVGSAVGPRGAPLVPDDFDAAIAQDFSVPDHSGSTSDAFIPPPVAAPSKSLIPDDWDLETIKADLTEMPAPIARERPVPFVGAAVQTDQFANEPAPVEVQPAASTPLDESAALVALLAGADVSAGLAARAAADPDATLRAAGALLRVAVAGVRALLIARGEVKREFRIEHTMLRPQNNNPLKFAATDEHAIAALLDPRTSAVREMQNAIDDLTAHQIATLAATQAAARALLESLAPADIEQNDKEGGFIPGAREKRLWEAYKRKHAKLIEQFDDDFDSAFGKAFARAYEQASVRTKND